MQVSSSPAHIAAQNQRQQPLPRRVGAADLADLAPATPAKSPATQTAAQVSLAAAPHAPMSHAEVRFQRPGALVDIRV